jgi:hypothetical protein
MNTDPKPWLNIVRTFCRQHAGQPGGEQAGRALHRHGHLQHRLHQAPEVSVCLSTSVGDPDPRGFGPPGSGSISQIYESDPDSESSRVDRTERLLAE